MSGPVNPTGSLDYLRLFRSLPTSYMVMDRDLVYVEVTDSYCATTGRTREELIGQYVFDAFPPTEDALDEDGVPRVQRSFERARDTGLPDTMPLQKYDIPDPATGGMSERWWSLISVPILDEHGEVVLIAQRAEDVTDWARDRDSGREAEERSAQLDRRVQEVEADLYARARELEAAVAAKEAAAARLASLASVALQLTAAESVEDLSRTVFERGLPVLGADGGAVNVRDDAVGRVLVVRSDSLPGTELTYGELELDSPLPAAHVARTGEPVLFSTREAGTAWSARLQEVYDATERGAWATLPLRVQDRLLGSLSVSWTVEREFTPDDVALMQGFAAQVSQALLRIEAIEAERRSARAAARLSETLQRSLLTAPPEVPGLGIAVRYQPAAQDAQVGGDWYDVVVTPDGSSLVVVGDVSGHDRTAAAAMGQLRNLLRGIAFESEFDGGGCPSWLLSRLDRAAAALDLGCLATAVLGRLGPPGPQGTRLCWSNAGHLPPVVRAPDGTISVLSTESDLLLGLQPETPRTEHEVVLAPGSTLVLFTDGLVERRDDSIDAGIGRVADALDRLGGSADVEAVADAVVACAEGVNQDDIAVLVVRVDGVPAAAGAGPVGRADEAAAGAGPVRATASLPARTTSPGEARRLVRRVLVSAGREEWSDAAELACSEIVSNAVLHAHTEVEVSVAVHPDRVEVEVRDRNPALPVPRRYGEQATTGRGMALVAALTDEHGVREAGPTGKTIWFTVRRGLVDAADALLESWDELEPEPPPTPGPDAPVPRQPLSTEPSGAGTPAAGTGRAVRLLGLPPALWLAARQHHDALLRELGLYLAEHTRSDVDVAAADRARLMISGAVLAALDAAGAGPADVTAPEVLDLDVVVPPDAGPAFTALQETLDVAERLARDGALLAAPGPVGVVRVRTWVCDQVVAQLAGSSPTQWRQD